METALVLLFIVSGLLLGGVLIWSGLAMSPFVKSGNSTLIAFTLFWIFNSNWFTPEGQETFRVERKRVLLVLGLNVFALISWKFFKAES